MYVASETSPRPQRTAPSAKERRHEVERQQGDRCIDQAGGGPERGRLRMSTLGRWPRKLGDRPEPAEVHDVEDDVPRPGRRRSSRRARASPHRASSSRDLRPRRRRGNQRLPAAQQDDEPLAQEQNLPRQVDQTDQRSLPGEGWALRASKSTGNPQRPNDSDERGRPGRPGGPEMPAPGLRGVRGRPDRTA